jgi:hypothetical protein
MADVFEGGNQPLTVIGGLRYFIPIGGFQFIFDALAALQ